MGELLDQEIEKEINSEILELVQRLIQSGEKELSAPETRKLYINGLKDASIRLGADQPCEAIVLKIIETKHLQQCTFDEETLAFLQEELYFYIDLLYTVITSTIELCAVRSQDIPTTGPVSSLFDTLTTLMGSVRDIPELDNLRKVLLDLSDDYPEKPELQRRIAMLVPQGTTDTCVYTVFPPLRMTQYTDASVLAILKEGYSTAEVAGLPPGIFMNPSKGEIKVDNAQELVKGVYTLFVRTQDIEGGININKLTLPIGKDNLAIYTLAPALKPEQYTNGDVLATVTDSDGSIISARLQGVDGADSAILPAGVLFNETNGTLTVGEKKLLVAGSYPLGIVTTDSFGFETEHRVVLIFKGNQSSSYEVYAPSDILDYRNKQVLAVVKDLDGPIIDSSVTGLPEGVIIDAPTGSIVVENASLLKEGTYQFAIKSITTTGTEKRCAMELTIGNGTPSVQYKLEPSLKVQNYLNGDKLASIVANGLSIESVFVASGIMPAGITLNQSTGDITVTDSTVLEAGNYGLSLQVKPTGLAAALHNIDLVLEPDYRAVYRVTYGKEVTDYKEGDLIAEVIDVDTIIAAEIMEGTLPPGTEMDFATGKITVSDVDDLEAGKYVLKILTSDAENGQTLCRIAIFFGGLDNEAVYTVLPPRATDSYKEGDVLATVEDIDAGGVVKAVVSKGALPLGVALNTSTGAIVVTDPAKLLAGEHGNIFIRTYDGVGNTSESEITLIFLDDLVITELVNNPKVTTAYTDDEQLSSLDVDDPDDVKSVLLASGKLPAGTRLNSVTGEITVSNHTLLVPGIYPVVLLVTDKNGGQTQLDFEIKFLEDEPAVWTVAPPKPIDLMTFGSLVAWASDPNGNIVSASVVSGSVPAGLTLNPFSGMITVSNTSLLTAGTFTLQVSTTDTVGGVTIADLEIIILNLDSEAIYTIEEPRNIDDYEVDDLLAFAEDADGTIVSAEILSGSIPPGCVLQSDGDIRVSDVSALTPGTFSATIRTTDSAGYMTDSVVIIEILDDDEAEYLISDPMNIDFITDGVLLARVTDDDATIVSATLTGGSLIGGTTLYTNSSMTGGTPWIVGDIVVTSVADIVPGTYSGIQIQTIDNTGGKTQFNLTITILPDNDAAYVIQFSRDIHSYRNQDIIAYPVDPDGAVTTASLESGTLHSGTEFDTTSGNISIHDRTGLIGGFKNVEIQTIDSTGGISQQFIGVDIKPLPNRQNRALCNQFICRFPDRLDEFEVLFADRLDPAFFDVNRSYLDNAKETANNIKADLLNASIESAYWSGSKDASIRSSFITLTAPLKDGILSTNSAIESGGLTPEQLAAAYRDLLYRTAIYNEIYVSMLGLACYRLNDITDDPSKPINMMFADLETQFDTVKDLESVQFVSENINTIGEGTFATHAVMKSKLFALAS